MRIARHLDSDADIHSVFMASGIPIYYLTARSRAHAANKSVTVSAEGGFRAILAGRLDWLAITSPVTANTADAWAKFREDLSATLPATWRTTRNKVQPVRVDGEETRGMWRGEQLEMSER